MDMDYSGGGDLICEIEVLFWQKFFSFYYEKKLQLVTCTSDEQ